VLILSPFKREHCPAIVWRKAGRSLGGLDALREECLAFFEFPTSREA
jgi:hypothetical protein